MGDWTLDAAHARADAVRVWIAERYPPLAHRVKAVSGYGRFTREGLGSVFVDDDLVWYTLPHGAEAVINVALVERREWWSERPW